MLASRKNVLRFLFGLAALALPLLLNSVASAQLEGRPIAQPYFDFPNWARWSNCRPHPLAWQFDPFVPYAQGEDPCADCDSCAPGNNSCVSAFVAHRPNGVYAIADFAPLTYDINHSTEIARLGTGGATLLNAGDFGNQFDAGSKLTIGYVYSPCVRIEGTYFGTYSFQNTDAVRDQTLNLGGGLGNITNILSNFADTPGLARNNFVSLGQFSAFNSAEANIRYWLDMPPGPFDVSLTFGARHVITREQLALHTESGAPLVANNDLAVRANNDMWGGQLGFQVSWLQSAHTWLEFDAKGAMFSNDASQNSLYTQTVGGVPTPFNTNAAGQRTAWMGDLSAAYNIQFHPGLVLRLGYQAVFINGVALAADNIQSDNNQLRLGPGQLVDNGEVVYHGPFVGLMWNR
ncbi:hypothetical protein [Anatilimnocola floriformis]|uniref:hypothetical protein n=1 Tax=Anatilimnocola floriformis TaxID=2948575 RepID=UPI0020C4217F|nr:hypothetical protein [Anatilimnocola floriformis]